MAAPDQIRGGFGAKTLGIPPASFPGRIHRQGSAAGAIAPVAAGRRPGQARPGRATISLAPRGAGPVAKGAFTEGALALGLVAKTICGGAVWRETACGGAITERAFAEGAVALGLVAKAV
jgi:hypothetical protein